MTNLSTKLNTKLESEGAEFLVLGHLLLHKIPSYKTYTNMPGYDIVAVNPEKNKSVKIQVKSRWATGQTSFPIKNFDCDFVVAAFLNRGSKDKTKEILAPQYYVFPVKEVEKVVKESGSWSKADITKIHEWESYENKWELIAKKLGLKL